MEMQCENEKRWNIALTLFYSLLLGGAILFFTVFTGRVPERISFFDFVLLALATFRIIRLLVYDRITQFLRDWFFETTTVGVCPKSGLKASIRHLFGCPWCMGVWVGFFVSFLYYLTPFAWFPILVLAVSGVGSFIQIVANMFGWRAENLKTITRGLHETKK